MRPAICTRPVVTKLISVRIAFVAALLQLAAYAWSGPLPGAVSVAFAQSAPPPTVTAPPIHDETTARLAYRDPIPVIAPGSEELLAEVLGRGIEFPGQCKLAGADLGNGVMRCSYTCASGTVVLDMLHPSQVDAGAMRTEKFGIELYSGSPPPGFTDALLARMRSEEGPFDWTWVGEPLVTNETGVGKAIPAAALVIIVILLVGFLVWRRRRAAAPTIGPL